jgi:hypothetical protein
MPSERLSELQAKFDRLRVTFDSAQTVEERAGVISGARTVLDEMKALAQESKESFEAARYSGEQNLSSRPRLFQRDSKSKKCSLASNLCAQPEANAVEQNVERWKHLCELAATEQDPAKLRKILEEINQLLAEKRDSRKKAASGSK